MDEGEQLKAAIARFECGDARQAVALLRPLVHQSADPRVAMLLGEAARRTQDDDTLAVAAARLIALDPTLARPLIWQGDIAHRAGRQREAAGLYAKALMRADRAPPSPSLDGELHRIRSVLDALRARLLGHVEEALSTNGLPPDRRPARVGAMLRALDGRAEAAMGLQRPTVHYVPGLPQRAWYGRDEFAWAPALEAHTAAIRNELLAVLAEDGAFAPYVEGEALDATRDYAGLLNNPAWGAFYLWRDGKPVAANLARCPATAAALTAVPQPQIGGRSPTAMFSLLQPGTHIPPHHGMLNARLIAHLPLIVPDQCGMRVADETRPWREGELAIFDDSVEHEAWNRSDTTRVVLLFDVARPELSDAEQRAVALIFQAVDAYAQTA